MRASVPLFPVIGLAVGALTACLAWALSGVFPPGVLALALVAWLLAVSGGLHVDGLADTADGFLSARPRERALEIMKDSHVGTMGIVTVVLVLALKGAALASLPASALWRATLLAPVAGRCALVFEMIALPAARQGEGLGSLFLASRHRAEAAWAGLALVGTAWLAAGVAGLVAVGAAAVTVLLFSVFCYRRIGGVTGDTLGAACELAELAVVVAFSAPAVAGLVA
jgi:adenosylcobinamide-GDP ribazoletransferase